MPRIAHPRRILTAALAMAALLSILATGTLRADSGSFDIYLRGVKAGNLIFNGITQGHRYSVVGRVRTSGIVRVLVDFRYDARAKGSLTGHRLIPASYDETAANGGKESELLMRYTKGTPKTVQFTPPRTPRAYDTNAATQKGTLDPMSAIFSLLRDVPKSQACKLDIAIFDGRRRMQFTLGTPQIDGNQISCTGEFRRIAGFKPRAMAKQTRFPFALTYTKLADGRYRVSNMAVHTRYGTVSMNRR